MKKLSFGIVFIMLLFTISCNKESDNNTDPIREENLTVEEKANELLLSFAAGDTSKASKYIDANQYIQHNHRYADGRETVINSILNGDYNNTQINIVRSFTDENLVVLHSEYIINGSSQIAFDVFRFENGFAVEHWDNFQDDQVENESGHDMIEGPNTISNLDQTENNRTIVNDFITRVMVEGNYQLMAEFIPSDSNFIQHNPLMRDGLSGMLEMMDTLTSQGFSFQYENLHKTIAMGNFVLTISEGQYGNPGQHAAYYDLFRLEEGKIAEHWDVIEVIATDDQWQNQNGKF